MSRGQPTTQVTSHTTDFGAGSGPVHASAHEGAAPLWPSHTRPEYGVGSILPFMLKAKEVCEDSDDFIANHHSE